MIFSDETIEFLTDKSELLNVLESYNIENPQNLKVVTGIEGLEEWDNLPMNQKTYGNSNEINYINLKPAIFTDNIEVSKEKLQNTKDVNTISRFIGVFVLGAILAVGAIVCYG